MPNIVLYGQGGGVIVKSVNEEEADETTRLGIISKLFMRIVVSLP
jgi:hypothetical protein